jgi:hypothetical protein
VTVTAVSDDIITVRDAYAEGALWARDDLHDGRRGSREELRSRAEHLATQEVIWLEDDENYRPGASVVRAFQRGYCDEHDGVAASLPLRAGR